MSRLSPAAAAAKAARDVAYHRASRRALAQLAREYPLRYAQLLAAFRSTGTDSPEQQAARRAVLERDATLPSRTKGTST
jgi:hypothetical protein